MVRSGLLSAWLLALLVMAAVTVFAATGDDAEREALKGLKRALASGDEDAIAQAVEGLGLVGTPALVDKVLKIGEAYPGNPVAGSVMNALSWLKNDAGIRYLGEQLGRKPSMRRALLIVGALEVIPDAVTIEPLIEALEQGRDPVFLTSVLRALRTKSDKRVVTALIDFFRKIEDQRDTLWAETRIALLAITGEQFVSYTDWANWWEIQREAWVPGEVDAGKALTGVFRPERGLDLPRLFGHEVPSTRLVFVIDTSGSMAKIDESSLEEGSQGGGRTRLERAQAELATVVRELREEVRFNIVAFNTAAQIWKEGELVKATPGNKDRAIKFIASWEPTGHTNTRAAVLMALAIPDVDTAILLSDGSPTIPGKGDIAETAPILEAIRKDNLFKKVTVHTLGFQGANVKFMKELARQNYGTYASVR